VILRSGSKPESESESERVLSMNLLIATMECRPLLLGAVRLEIDVDLLMEKNLLNLNTTVLQNCKSLRISKLRRIWRVNRNGESRAMDRENIDENYKVPTKLQLCNTVVLTACGVSPDTFPQELSSIHKSHC
jgi:hypothetical protein